MGESYHGERSLCPQLTQFILERVILGKNGVGIPTSASSNKPVHIGVPAVHKATEMIFFKITFWQKRNKNIPHGDVLQSFPLDIQVCFPLPLSTGILYQNPWTIPVKKREISCNELRLPLWTAVLPLTNLLACKVTHCPLSQRFFICERGIAFPPYWAVVSGTAPSTVPCSWQGLGTSQAFISAILFQSIV